MSVPILYCMGCPDLAQTGADGSVAVVADDGTSQHQTVLATVGGLLTFTLTSRGSAFTSGTYANIPIVTTAAGGSGGTVTVGVSATGQITVVSAFIPGYGYALGNFGFSNTVLTSTIGTAGSVLATIGIASVLPCSAPFPPGTKYIEMECDANGPANITLDSTLASTGFTNGILTTLQSTLTTTATRLATNERLLRRVSVIQAPIPAGSPFNTVAGPLLQFQVIMGTAAA
jgi:hypothetical protein